MNCLTWQTVHNDRFQSFFWRSLDRNKSYEFDECLYFALNGWWELGNCPTENICKIRRRGESVKRMEARETAAHQSVHSEKCIQRWRIPRLANSNTWSNSLTMTISFIFTKSLLRQNWDRESYFDSLWFTFSRWNRAAAVCRTIVTKLTFFRNSEIQQNRIEFDETASARRIETESVLRSMGLRVDGDYFPSGCWMA